MVSILWGVIAFSFGLLLYLVPPALGPTLPIDLRLRVGHFYYRYAFRSFSKVAFVRRLLGGYELLPISVDDEQKLAQVTLSSGLVSDDKKLPFKDPDNRIQRLYQKPVALVAEEVPAAIDAELAELGYWVRQHETTRGLERGGKIDPYVRMKNTLRLVDPMDVLSLVGKDVEPENVETATQLTKQRFDQYGSKVGLAETVGTLTGFAVGIGGVGMIKYLNQRVLDSTGGGGSVSAPIPLGQIVLQVPMDMVVMLW